MNKYLPKKTIGRFGIFLCVLLVQLNSLSQQKPSFSSDSLFNKMADTTIRPFAESAPYYILTWKDAAPKNIRMIRRLDEKIAIIEVRSRSELNSLLQQTQVAPATNQWKLSPGAEKAIERWETGQQTYLLTSTNIDSLLAVLKEMSGNLVILSIDKLSKSVLVRASAKFVKEKLLAIKEIIFIDL